MPNITRLHAKGLTQFYFNLLILKTTYFQTQLITQLQPFFLSKKKKNRRGREKERSKERGREGWWRSSVAGKTKPAEIGVHQAAAPRPPPHYRYSSSPPPNWVRSAFLQPFSLRSLSNKVTLSLPPSSLQSLDFF